MPKRRTAWPMTVLPKGRATPKRAAQRARRLAVAREARKNNPAIQALYDLFAPPPRRK